ncbi:MAG: cytochrome c biogenesis protein [Halanaerobiaceae bacterium]
MNKEKMKKWNQRLLYFLIICLVIDIYLIFIYSPLEKSMGIIQKIFYLHLTCAWIGFLAFFVVFVLSIVYLKYRNLWINHLALASAELGTIFITMVLISGSFWARSIWNTWWTWDPRLTTTLILWFIYMAYILIQSGGKKEKRRRFSAVYGIIAFINVPLVYFSIRWWRTIHPLVISRSGGINLTLKMAITLIFSLFAFNLLYIYLLNLRYSIIKLNFQIEKIKFKIGRK